MESKIKIVVPSHKRADRVITRVEGAILCVPDDQEGEYREHNPQFEIVTHPSTIRGLVLKRQWILDKFGDVAMVDDDIVAILRCWHLAGRRSRLTPTEARDALLATGETCRRMGAFLFGFASGAAPEYYTPQSPFKLSGVATNGVFGILKGSKLFYHERAKTVGDFWIAGLNAYHHRYCFLDLRFAAHAKDTFIATGGAAEYRTEDVERESTAFLKEMFGDAVKMKVDKMGHRSSLKSKHQRFMEIPW